VTSRSSAMRIETAALTWSQEIGILLTQEIGILLVEPRNPTTILKSPNPSSTSNLQPQRDWYFVAEQPAPAPHLAHPEGCAALRVVLVTLPRVSRSPGCIVSRLAFRVSGFGVRISCRTISGLQFPYTRDAPGFRV